MDIRKICINCMREKPSAEPVCPRCGFSPDYYEAPEQDLASWTILNGRYLVGTRDHEDSCSIIYHGLDLVSGGRVLIREFFVRGLMRRQPDKLAIAYDGSQAAMFQSARTQFAHFGGELVHAGRLPGIEQVGDCFKENHTWYLIQGWTEGTTLSEYAARFGGKLPDTEVTQNLLQIAYSIEALHQRGIYPLRITAEQILVTSGGSWILRDSMVPYNPEQGRCHWIQGMSPSPEEAKNTAYSWGPWSDVYQLAALYNKCIHGNVKASATEEEPTTGFFTGNSTAAVLRRALASKPAYRWQTMREFADALNASLHAPKHTGKTNAYMEDEEPAGRTPGGSHSEDMDHSSKDTKSGPKLAGILGILAAVIAAVGVIFGAAYVIHNLPDKEEDTETVRKEDKDDPSDKDTTSDDGSITAETTRLAVTRTGDKDATDAAIADADRYEDGGTTTVMVYMVGSNLESGAGLGSIEFDEMCASGLDTDKTNLLLCVGGATQWHTDGIDPKSNTILRIKDGKLSKEAVNTDDFLSTGDPANLTSFINYCTDKYPADHYALILWDHGGGPVLGFGSDEFFEGDGLSLKEMRQAMDGTVFAAEDRKLDWIGFDACLMASIEVCDAWEEYAGYLIASQDTSPGIGWNYAFLETLNETANPVRIAQSIEDRYIEGIDEAVEETREQKGDFYNPVTTISCADLGQVKTVVEDLDQLLGAMDQDLGQGEYARLARRRDHMKMFGLAATSGAEYGYDLVDMQDMAAVLGSDYPAQAEELLEDLGKLIICRRSNLGEDSGMSMYFPYNDTPMYEQLAGDMLEEIATSENYTTFFRNFTQNFHQGSKTDWKLKGIDTDSKRVSLTLTEAQAKDASAVYYTVLRKGEDGGYTPVRSMVRTLVDKNRTVYADRDQDLVYAITDKKTLDLTIPIKQIEYTDSQAEYITEEVHLVAAVKDYFDLGASDAICVNFVEKAKDKEIQIRNWTQQPGIEFGTPTADQGRNEISLAGWEGFAYDLPLYKPTKADDGTLLPCSEWEAFEDGETLKGTIPFDLSLTFATLSSKENSGEYAVQFIVRDVYGEMHGSDLTDL